MQRTELASGRITSTETIIVELIETDETPAVVIVRWPAKPSVFHPRRFGDVAATVARLFAVAAPGWQRSSKSAVCDHPGRHLSGRPTTCYQLPRLIPRDMSCYDVDFVVRRSIPRPTGRRSAR